MNTKSVIIAVLLAIFAMVFAMLNVHAVPTHIFLGESQVSLAFIMVIGLFLGMLITLLLSVPPLLSANKNRKEAEGKLTIMEKMLQDNIVKNNRLQAQIDEINQVDDEPQGA